MGEPKSMQVVVVGAEQEGVAACRSLLGMKGVKVVGVLAPKPYSSGQGLIRELGVDLYEELEPLLAGRGIDVVVETTGSLEVLRQINRVKDLETVVVEGAGDHFLGSVIKERSKYLEMLRIQGEMTAILNAMSEGILVAENTGKITYVNPAFTRITGIPAKDRIGKNIFEVNPASPVVRCLITKEPRYGERYKGTSKVDVIGNTSPILVDGEMYGAVLAFRPLDDYVKMAEELRKSNTLIEGLYNRMGQITGKQFTFDQLVGKSKTLRAAVEMAKKAARSDSTVLILGESGTGKELFAHAIHNTSRRSSRPLISINCAAIPEALMESEFFGSERGGPGGENKTRLGKLELAHGGTLFLDEIGDLNLLLQAKLLRVLETMEFERVGGNESIKVNVRIMAASSRNLAEMVRRGEFREELYYRLNVVELPLPPLRQRKEDIPLLIQHFIQRYNRKFRKKVRGVRPETLEELLKYPWPGNVRELENAIERGMVAAEEEWLGPKEMAPYIEGASTQETILPRGELLPLEKVEELLIMEALNRFGNHLEGKKQAAHALGISLATLYNKLKRIHHREKSFSKF